MGISDMDKPMSKCQRGSLVVDRWLEEQDKAENNSILTLQEADLVRNLRVALSSSPRKLLQTNTLRHSWHLFLTSHFKPNGMALPPQSPFV